MRRNFLGALVMFVALGVVTAQGDLFQDIYRGLEIAATPTGYPVFSSGDGTRVNGARTGRVRIVPNGIGPGYELQFDRTFGVDSTGRTETLHLGGLADLTLQGNTQMTLGYNGKKFRTVHGELGANNLGYDIRTKVCAQDAELFGVMNMVGAFELNPFGCYRVTYELTNSDSKLLLDGVVVRDEQDMNFDVGPIVVEGNIFLDATAALLTSFGVDTSGLEALTPKSPMDEINEAIENQIQQATVVAGETVESDLAQLLLQTVLEGNGEASQALIEGLVADVGEDDNQSARVGPMMVPEPGTLALLALGTVAVWISRHRR